MADPAAADWGWWRERRLPAGPLHLDTAAAGRSSLATLAATAGHAEREATSGAYVAQEEAGPLLAEGRANLARLFGVPEGGVAFMPSAQAALDTLLAIWPLREGDAVAVVPRGWRAALGGRRPGHRARGHRVRRRRDLRHRPQVAHRPAGRGRARGGRALVGPAPHHRSRTGEEHPPPDSSPLWLLDATEANVAAWVGLCTAVADPVAAPSAIVALRAANGQDIGKARSGLMPGIVTTAASTLRAPRDMTEPLLRVSPHVDCTAGDLDRLRQGPARA